jgi:hypothetical protein
MKSFRRRATGCPCAPKVRSRKKVLSGVEQTKEWVRRQALWLLFAAVVVVNVLVILGVLGKGLDAVAATGLVSASAAAYSAVLSAVATRRAVEISEKLERTGERATEALSRSLLPDTISILSSDANGRLQMTLATAVPMQPQVRSVRLFRVKPETGKRVPLRLVQASQTGYLTFDATGLPPSPTVGQFREWADGFEVYFSDAELLVDWACPLNERLGPEPDDSPLPFTTFNGDIIDMHELMRPMSRRV